MVSVAILKGDSPEQSAPRRTRFRWYAAVGLLIAAAGCAQLPGGGESAEEAAERERIERLRAEAPESLKSSPGENKPASVAPGTPAVVSDVPSTAGKTASEMTSRPSPPETVRRPPAKAKKPARGSDIPSAAEVGL